MKKSGKKIAVFPIVNGIIFILLCLIILVPIWKILVDSFDLKTAYGMKFWPEEFGLDGYKLVFSNPTLYRPLLISVVTTICGTLMALALSTMGAYVLIQWDMPAVYHDFQRRYDSHLPGIAVFASDKHAVGGYPFPGAERI